MDRFIPDVSIKYSELFQKIDFEIKRHRLQREEAEAAGDVEKARYEAGSEDALMELRWSFPASRRIT